MIRTRDKKAIEKTVLENGADKYFTDWRALEPSLIIYKKGEYIQRLEEDLTALKFCVSGEFEVSSVSAGGKQFTVSREEAPNLFADMEFAAGHKKTTAMNAIALTEVVCLEIPLAENEEILMSDNTFLRFMCRTIGEKALKSSGQYEKMAQSTAEGRLSGYLLVRAEGDEIDTHLGDASRLLGISYRHMMRLLQGFCEMGYLKKTEKKGRYVIADKSALEEMSLL